MKQLGSSKVVLDNKYESVTQLFIMNKRFVFRVFAENCLEGTTQTEINYMKLGISPSGFNVYEQGYENRNGNSTIREDK